MTIHSSGVKNTWTAFQWRLYFWTSYILSLWMGFKILGIFSNT